MDLRMSSDDRLAFLRDTRIGVLAVCRGDAAPLVTPLWFAVDDAPAADGDRSPSVVMVTAAASEKAVLLAAHGSASLCVHDDTPPYRFVTVAGPITIEPPEPRVRRLIAERYMPPSEVDSYLAMTADAPTVTLRLHPASWRSNDFARMASA